MAKERTRGERWHGHAQLITHTQSQQAWECDLAWVKPQGISIHPLNKYLLSNYYAPSFIFLVASSPLTFQVIYFKEGKYSLLFLNPSISTRKQTLIVVMNLRVVQRSVSDKGMFFLKIRLVIVSPSSNG